MLKITATIAIPDDEIHFSFIRSPGPGGQNVNKVASAVLMRFNVLQSAALPADVRTRLITLLGARLTQRGDLIIKASRFRTQERNKADALERLKDIIKRVAIPPKRRKKTKPTYASKQKRLKTKKLHARTKALRSQKPSLAD